MESVLRGLIYDACLVYLDDIIVIGRTFQEHNIFVLAFRYSSFTLGSICHT
jgi:hypothetical protein